MTEPGNAPLAEDDGARDSSHNRCNDVRRKHCRQRAQLPTATLRKRIADALIRTPPPSLYSRACDERSPSLDPVTIRGTNGHLEEYGFQGELPTQRLRDEDLCL